VVGARGTNRVGLDETGEGGGANGNLGTGLCTSRTEKQFLLASRGELLDFCGGWALLAGTNIVFKSPVRLGYFEISALFLLPQSLGLQQQIRA